MEQCTECGREGLKLWIVDGPAGNPAVLYCGACLLRVFAKVK